MGIPYHTYEPMAFFSKLSYNSKTMIDIIVKLIVTTACVLIAGRKARAI